MAQFKSKKMFVNFAKEIAPYVMLLKFPALPPPPYNSLMNQFYDGKKVSHTVNYEDQK